MELTFAATKMHGIGNDYLYIDGFLESGMALYRKLRETDRMPQAAVALCNRHTGVGGDGIIWILPNDGSAERAGVRMEMYNSDGSRGAMCGNGVRCVGAYCISRGHGQLKGGKLSVKTDNGMVELTVEEPSAPQRAEEVVIGRRPAVVEVDMGSVYVSLAEERMQADALVVHRHARVDVGNPHCVILLSDCAFGAEEVPLLDYLRRKDESSKAKSDFELLAEWQDLPAYGSQLERRLDANIEFVATDRSSDGTLLSERVKVRTWERGSGETQACGTGACAVASVLKYRSREKGTDHADAYLTLHLRGGDLAVKASLKEERPNGGVFAALMKGEAQEVYTFETSLQL